VWAQLVRDRIGVSGCECGHITPLGAAVGQHPGDVEVEVRHGLVSRDAVVLLHGRLGLSIVLDDQEYKLMP